MNPEILPVGETDDIAVFLSMCPAVEEISRSAKGRVFRRHASRKLGSKINQPTDAKIGRRIDAPLPHLSTHFFLGPFHLEAKVVARTASCRFESEEDRTEFTGEFVGRTNHRIQRFRACVTSTASSSDKRSARGCFVGSFARFFVKSSLFRGMGHSWYAPSKNGARQVRTGLRKRCTSVQKGPGSGDPPAKGTFKVLPRATDACHEDFKLSCTRYSTINPLVS